MEKGKIFEFIRKRGTLGILTLALVGIVAFASYRTSYPGTKETETVETEEAKTVSTPQATAQKKEVQTEKAASVHSTDVTNEGSSTAKITAKKEEKTTENDTAENETEETAQVLSGNAISPTVQFSEDSALSWPAAGSILMDYSMDGTVYFQTLNEYKYNPALIIGSEVGNPVVASAKGIVESISRNEETGTTLTLNIGDNYELIYGQLKDIAVSEGDVVEQGSLLGYISEPTRYYCEEGSNLYFSMKKDGQIVDPCLYLE